jgi:hypothetical protein
MKVKGGEGGDKKITSVEKDPMEEEKKKILF